jgi:hypothetical protein
VAHKWLDLEILEAPIGLEGRNAGLETRSTEQRAEEDICTFPLAQRRPL